MNRKPTIVLGALAAIGAAYLLLSGGDGDPTESRKRLWPEDFRGDRLTSIEIARPGAETIVLERRGEKDWRLVRPVARPADPDLVNPLVSSFDRLSRTGAMDPGRPEASPKITGLDKPRIEVTFREGARSEKIAFGNEPQINRGTVFFSHEGEPQVFIAEISFYDAYNKTAAELRDMRLARYDATRVKRIDLATKFQRGKDGVEYEESVAERLDEGGERGWFLVKPWKERLDEMKVTALKTGLMDLKVEAFEPAADLAAKGLDPARVKLRLTLADGTPPVEVRFGDPAGKAGKSVYALLPETGETARLDLEKFKGFPHQRKHLRTDVLFPFAKEDVRRIEIDAPSLGRVVILRQDKKKGGELVTVEWEVLEPVLVRVVKDDVEFFINNVLSPHYRLTDFMSVQEDLKSFGLDPPEVTLSVETRNEVKHKFYFGLRGDGYLRKEGVAEIYKVSGDLVKLLQRLELNFRERKMFDVARPSIREFGFEWKDPGGVHPRYYRLRFDEDVKVWKFSDALNKDKEADADRVGGLLTQMNYIEAKAFIGRDARTAREHRLEPRTATGTLTILWKGGPPGGTVLYISEDVGDRPQDPTYYARFEGDPLVFVIDRALVESLKRVPLKKE